MANKFYLFEYLSLYKCSMSKYIEGVGIRLGEQSSVELDFIETSLGFKLFPVCEGRREVFGQVLSVHARIYEHAGHHVRVHIRAGPSVLDVALATGGEGPCWDADGGISVTNTVGESVSCADIETVAQSLIVVVAAH